MKKLKKPLRSKQKPYMTVLKIILIVLTLIYPLFMTILTGAGIVYNRSSYGSTITGHGISLIVSGIIISAAAFLCIFRKSFLNLIAPITSLIGSGVCMRALFKLISHADSAGWYGNGKYSAVPVSDMYKERVLPVLAVTLLTVVISAIQYFSYDACEERRTLKKYREDKENAPAPSIIGDENDE